MDFVALIIFLALYYLRPQEWFADFNALRPVQLLSFMAVWAMAQGNKLKPRDLVRTPLDWLVLAYFVWTLIAGFQFTRTIGEIEAVLLFYFVAVRSLDTIPRQKIFLAWWGLFIVIIAALAVASTMGFDPLGSNDRTEGIMKGRLMLNLSVFDNPNALAHSVIPALPIIYYLIYWRRTAMKAGLILMAIPLWCIFLTQSKGAYLCGFATLLATLTFGRSKIAQVFIAFFAIVFGYGLLYQLPRMNELSHSKTDPAIQGRIAALTYGYQLMQNNYFGIGLGNFEDMFTRYGPLEKDRLVHIIPAHDELGNNGALRHIDEKRIPYFEYHHFLKATHGAYNQNGAELGYVGLFLFIGILYCCIRTLLLVKSNDDEEERIRRCLFAMVVAYAVSSWMVDFCYRPTFFMFVAAISAFHRHLLKKQELAAEPVVEMPVFPARPWMSRIPPLQLPGIPGFTTPLPAGSAASLVTPELAPAAGSMLPATIQSTPLEARPFPGANGSGRVLGWHKKENSFQDILLKKFIWTRLGFLDLAITLALTFAAIRYWQHLMKTF
jgi:hypothetical protein